MDMFKWERPGLDFPFYNDKNITGVHVGILLAAVLISILAVNVLPIPQNVMGLITVGSGLAAFLIVARGKIGMLIKPPKLGDLGLIPATVFLQFFSVGILSFATEAILGIKMASHPGLGADISLGLFATMFFELIGEEMIKINLFLAVLIIVYKATGNRKMGVIVGTVITLTVFGLMHLDTYGGVVIQVLLNQGLCTFFGFFCYLKTKNLLVSYAQHCLLDFIPFALMGLTR